MKTIAVIPARYESTRLKGKPLLDICGHPMIWWVYQNVLKVKHFADVIIATDDHRIVDVCNSLGMKAVMTDRHPTAIHRIYELSQKYEADLYVQINGDEPLLDPQTIGRIFDIEKLPEGEYGINLIATTNNAVEINDVSNIKVVFSESGKCLYMSRTPIPTPFQTLEYSYHKHLGVIAYSREMLAFYAKSSPGRLESIEGIDLLRFMDYDKPLYIINAGEVETLSVDTAKDLEAVRKKIAERQCREAVNASDNV
ncbi:MAG TPA: 3-deoxy-manno-octulosonate cytidylyltransferase [Lachnospiraceae bacterium]|nr:3-deoxy-manno-octulosonate cytidylyltransferase [Lachnospiraceae bacterium]